MNFLDFHWQPGSGISKKSVTGQNVTGVVTIGNFLIAINCGFFLSFRHLGRKSNKTRGQLKILNSSENCDVDRGLVSQIGGFDIRLIKRVSRTETPGF